MVLPRTTGRRSRIWRRCSRERHGTRDNFFDLAATPAPFGCSCDSARSDPAPIATLFEAQPSRSSQRSSAGGGRAKWRSARRIHPPGVAPISDARVGGKVLLTAPIARVWCRPASLRAAVARLERRAAADAHRGHRGCVSGGDSCCAARGAVHSARHVHGWRRSVRDGAATPSGRRKSRVASAPRNVAANGPLGPAPSAGFLRWSTRIPRWQPSPTVFPRAQNP